MKCQTPDLPMTPMETPESCVPHGRTGISLPESLLILIATAVIAAAVLQAEPLQSANDRSRWATVWSLVERGTYQIDEIDNHAKWSTIDKVRFRANEKEPWHFYSSKPPLLSTLVAGLYAAERWTLGYGLFNHTALVTRLLLVIVNVLTFFLMLRSLSLCLRLLDTAVPVRLFVLAAAGFGSMLNPYLTTLNNHTPAAACAMFAITAAVRLMWRRELAAAHNRELELKPEASARVGNEPHEDPSLTLRVSWGARTDFAKLGFFAALTCCFELPAALMGVLAFGLAVMVNRRQAIARFLPAAAIPLAAFFITNWLATGGVKPFYTTYGTDTYVYEHNGIPSYWSNPRDLDANTETWSTYLFHCLLGHHGLLSLTPVLMLTWVGWIHVTRRNSRTRRWLIHAGAVLTLVALGFYLTRTENYNYGGNSVGLRWMLWLSPFWWIAMVPALEELIRRHRRIPRMFTIGLLLPSIISVSWSLDRPWRPSWLYEQMEAAGKINYRTLPEPFSHPRSTVLGDIPLQRGATITWISSDGERLTLTIDAGEQLLKESGHIPITMVVSEGTATTTWKLSMDRGRFLHGESIEDFAAAPSPESGIGVIDPSSILQGVPDARTFNSGGTIWVPSKIDPTKAWKVERGAVRVLVDGHPVFGKCWHRCDVMYCDQLPFGVLQWKTTVTSEASGEILSTKTWTADGY